ncbi:MAG: DUF805 domain-containing protein [Phascolarctobacterium sp.]
MDTPQVKETWKQKFFSTKGRINRKTYFLRGLAIQAVMGLIDNVLVISALGMFFSGEEAIGLALFLLIAVIGIVVIYSGICLGIRRWHDLNKSGWYCLLCILIIPAIYIIFAKGTDGPNKYGPKPVSDN